MIAWGLHACHLAKVGFDRAVKFIDTFSKYDVPKPPGLVVLRPMMDDTFRTVL